jgi:hypothetical protein
MDPTRFQSNTGLSVYEEKAFLSKLLFIYFHLQFVISDSRVLNNYVRIKVTVRHAFVSVHLYVRKYSRMQWRLCIFFPRY